MKPTVTFGRIIGWIDAKEQGIAAALGQVEGHPRPGTQNVVHTSRVVGIEYGEVGAVNTIETKNTVYTRR